MFINLSNIAVLNIKGSDYCCIISLYNEPINLLQNANFTEKVKHYKLKIFERMYKNGKNDYKIWGY